MISAKASACPRCGAIFNRIFVAPVGLAIMLAIAVLYALFQRYWRIAVGLRDVRLLGLTAARPKSHATSMIRIAISQAAFAAIAATMSLGTVSYEAERNGRGA
jgi:hypothetical protein